MRKSRDLKFVIQILHKKVFACVPHLILVVQSCSPHIFWSTKLCGRSELWERMRLVAGAERAPYQLWMPRPAACFQLLGNFQGPCKFKGYFICALCSCKAVHFMFPSVHFQNGVSFQDICFIFPFFSALHGHRPSNNVQMKEPSCFERKPKAHLVAGSRQQSLASTSAWSRVHRRHAALDIPLTPSHVLLPPPCLFRMDCIRILHLVWFCLYAKLKNERHCGPNQRSHLRDGLYRIYL